MLHCPLYDRVRVKAAKFIINWVIHQSPSIHHARCLWVTHSNTSTMLSSSSFHFTSLLFTSIRPLSQSPSALENPRPKTEYYLKSCRTKPNQTESNRVKPNQTESNQAKPYILRTCLSIILTISSRVDLG